MAYVVRAAHEDPPPRRANRCRYGAEGAPKTVPDLKVSSSVSIEGMLGRLYIEIPTNKFTQIDMLSGSEAIATVGVTDIEAARKFYGDTLGLEQAGNQGPQVILYRSGSTKLLVYESRYAGTNEATTVTWLVGDDVDAAAQALRERGVKFEHYEMPDTVREGDVHVSGRMRVAWFKDPDGNIHSIVNQ